MVRNLEQLNRNLPPLNALRAFEVSARLLSFTRAAEELNVTQGAVSQHVKQLEEYLDTQLFIRKARKLELTQAGLAYLPTLTEAFNCMQTSTEQLFGSKKRTLLTVKCGATFMQRWLMPNLPDFYQHNPDISIRLMSTVWPSQNEVVDADLEICNGHGEWTGMKIERLTNEIMQVVASPKFLELYPIHNDAMRISQLPLINVVGERETWRHWFRNQGMPNFIPMPILECDTSNVAIEAACNDNGLLLTRSFSAQDALKDGRLVMAHKYTMPSDGAHYLVLPNKLPLPKVTTFCEWLKKRLIQTGMDYCQLPENN